MTDPITLETRFDEQGHPEVWRNEVAKELNTLLAHARMINSLACTAESIATRVAETEEIQIKS